MDSINNLIIDLISAAPISLPWINVTVTYSESGDRYHDYQHRTTVVTIIIVTANNITHHRRLYHHHHRHHQLSPGFADSDWVYPEDNATTKHLDNNK